MLLDKGLASSLKEAQALVVSGKVLAGDVPVEKPGTEVASEVVVRLKSAPTRYVSRGGIKLEKALQEFGVDPSGKICLDIGASTGGFTDCLLQHGAQKVYAIDVGTNQLIWKLRRDPRVTVMEKTHFCHLPVGAISEPVALCVIDVSFISLKAIFENLPPFLSSGADVIALIKPQFEVPTQNVGPKGVVTDPQLHTKVCADIRAAAELRGLQFLGLIESPLLGAEGNKEFLMRCQGTLLARKGSKC